jgi:pseudouridine synthase
MTLPGERLQKRMARAGVASRRASERLVAEGRVRVNGEIVRRPGVKVTATDRVEIDGLRLSRAEAPVYVLLNKPRGVITTLADPEGRPTVKDCLPPLPCRLFPVGRLDAASEGLLIFTNDGNLAHALLHPSRGVPRTYRVRVRGLPDAEALSRLRQPFRLDGRLTRPAEVSIERLGPRTVLRVVLREGRKHHVREMFRRIGHPVMRLKRVAYGPLKDSRLRPGESRLLTPTEVAALLAAGGLAAAPRAARRVTRSRSRKA